MQPPKRKTKIRNIKKIPEKNWVLPKKLLKLLRSCWNSLTWTIPLQFDNGARQNCRTDWNKNEMSVQDWNSYEKRRSPKHRWLASPMGAMSAPPSNLSYINAMSVAWNSNPYMLTWRNLVFSKLKTSVLKKNTFFILYRLKRILRLFWSNLH